MCIGHLDHTPATCVCEQMWVHGYLQHTSGIVGLTAPLQLSLDTSPSSFMLGRHSKCFFITRLCCVCVCVCVQLSVQRELSATRRLPLHSPKEQVPARGGVFRHSGVAQSGGHEPLDGPAPRPVGLAIPP